MTNTKMAPRSNTLSGEIRALVATLPRTEGETIAKWLDRCHQDGLLKDSERRMFGHVPQATWLRIESDVENGAQ
jgi:hypothetical protein